jgi:asparagine synthetase B (glutamine-hydrolysing)
LFAGYAHLRRDAGVAADHAPSRGVMLPGDDPPPLDGVREGLGFVPTWLAAKASLGRRVRALLVADLAAGDPYTALIDRLAIRSRSPLHASAEAWIRTALAGYILRTLGDGMEMAHGIEGRVPFLDDRVAEAAFALDAATLTGIAIASPANAGRAAAPEAVRSTIASPANAGRAAAPEAVRSTIASPANAGRAAAPEAVRRLIDKPVLRRAMTGVVPADVLARPKQPFLAPPLSRVAPELVQDTLRAHAARSPLVDRVQLRAVLDALPAMSAAEQQAWDPALMLVLSAAILEARYCR